MCSHGYFYQGNEKQTRATLKGHYCLYYLTMSHFTLKLQADLSVYPKFWGHQVFIYSGYCSCHCRLPSEESTSGIPLI